jgi:hypothetical protein
LIEAKIGRVLSAANENRIPADRVQSLDVVSPSAGWTHRRCRERDTSDRRLALHYRDVALFALVRPSNNHITPVMNAARPAVQLCWP